MKRTFLLFLALFFFKLNAQNADPYKIDYSNSEPLEYQDDLDDESTDNTAKKHDLKSSVNPDEPDMKFEYDNYTPRGLVGTGFSFFPIYERVDSNTTVGGLDFSYYFRRYGEPPQSNPNYIRTVFTAGQNQYVNLGIDFDNYWKNSEYNIYASVNYLRRWAAYYEIGKNNPQLLGTYRADDARFDLMYRQKILPSSYIGAKYEYENDNMSSRTPSNVFDEKVFTGLTGGGVSGLGIVFGNLPNESIFSPRNSFAYELSGIFYLNILGSKSNFGKYTIDVREYLGIFKNHVLALQVYMNFTSGTPTYKQLPSIGDIFRAYSHDKYMDYHMMAIKGEYRWTLFEGFSLTAFLGAGYHSKAINKFRLNDYLPSYGAGFRYLLSQALNSYARLEYFEGRGSRGFMLGIGDDL